MTLAATRSARPQWPCARCQATFYVRDRRRRDADNALASLKAAFDGVTDGGLLADDHGLSHAPVRFEVDAANPRVELVFSALPAEAPR